MLKNISCSDIHAEVNFKLASCYIAESITAAEQALYRLPSMELGHLGQLIYAKMQLTATCSVSSTHP